MGEYVNLLLEVNDERRVATLTVNRADKRNALNHALLQELGAAIEEIRTDPRVRALIVTGAGNKAFVAGADIGEIAALEGAADGADFSRFGQEIFGRLEKLPIPVIIAINGYALGGGLELALAGDYRIAADTAQLGQTEVGLGLIPGYGGTQRLARLIGPARAKLLIFTAERVGADEAYRLGLVDRVVPAAELSEEAFALASSLAMKAPRALTLAKRAINEGASLPLEEGLRLESQLFGEVIASNDRREGTAAFFEKRQPQWSGE